MSEISDPTFVAGHAGNVLCEAVTQSSRERRWAEVTL
jgi:hypothetical protein